MIYNPNFNCTEFDAIKIWIEVSCRELIGKETSGELWHKKRLDEHFHKRVVKP